MKIAPINIRTIILTFFMYLIGKINIKEEIISVFNILEY